jgi:threonine dehydratase
MTDWAIPTFSDVLAAKARIAPYLPRTALHRYPQLDDLVGTQVWVKHENHQPVGAFKVRGGVNLVAQLSEGERERGLITASTGNHGQSIAFASKLFGVRAIICVPEESNPVKVAAMQGYGAEIVFHGSDFDDAREECERLADQFGYRYVHSGNEPHLIAGVATGTLEITEDVPDLDVLIVPLGGGSGASGACIVTKAVRPEVEVIAVQSESSQAAYQSWIHKRLVESENKTFAEGLATRTSFELPQRILRDLLDDFVLISDAEIRKAVALMIEKTRNLVEPAGAASLAAALGMRERLVGRKVALVCSGGNISPRQLMEILSTEID